MQASDGRPPVTVTVDLEPPATPRTSHLASCTTRMHHLHAPSHGVLHRAWCATHHWHITPCAGHHVSCNMHPFLAYNTLHGRHTLYTARQCRCNYDASSDSSQIPRIHHSTWAAERMSCTMMPYPDGVFDHVGVLRVHLFIMPSLVFPFSVDSPLLGESRSTS
jgi:hypothetical protein